MVSAPLILASHANVLRGSSRVPTPRGGERLRDESVRTSAWEATLISDSTRLSLIRQEVFTIFGGLCFSYFLSKMLRLLLKNGLLTFIFRCKVNRPQYYSNECIYGYSTSLNFRLDPSGQLTI